MQELGQKWEAKQQELVDEVAEILKDVPGVEEADIAGYKHMWADGVIISSKCEPGFRIEQSDAIDARYKAGDHNVVLSRLAMRYDPSAAAVSVSLIKQFERAWTDKADAK